MHMRVLRVAVYEGEMSKARERREGRREKGERGAGGRTEAQESVRGRTEKAQENREKR